MLHPAVFSNLENNLLVLNALACILEKLLIRQLGLASPYTAQQ